MTSPLPERRWRRVDDPIVRLPGGGPQPFTPATGLLIPAPTDDVAHAAMLHVQVWLHHHGFTRDDVPYPLRIILGTDQFHVSCRTGGHGRTPEDHWRAAVLLAAFPEHLLQVLHADMICGPDSARVGYLIATARPNHTIEENN